MGEFLDSVRAGSGSECGGPIRSRAEKVIIFGIFGIFYSTARCAVKNPLSET
jgi:hypothetical protein